MTDGQSELDVMPWDDFGAAELELHNRITALEQDLRGALTSAYQIWPYTLDVCDGTLHCTICKGSGESKVIHAPSCPISNLQRLYDIYLKPNGD